MSNTVIKVENISKQYRLGEVGTGSLGHDINRWWHKVRGKEDPYLKIGESNDRTQKGNSEYVWALQNINFEVKQGEVMGIIGRNGAGKSTLLKILSRTTTPTTGNIKIKGRVASLLEVGTGFHPELTGRDNIFLNGAILGMSKQEIKNKFDEIVDFAGVERYIDTPVKRYSSGMYVRLAFGVAAHLEPEILIVDEVLAVGDAEFQKKALGKMKDVSNKEGRTVLFVSHNLGAMKNLCHNGLIFENGQLVHQSNIIECISNYHSRSISLDNKENYYRDGNGKVEILTVKIFDTLLKERHTYLMGEDILISVDLKFNLQLDDVEIGLNVKNQEQNLIFHMCNYDDCFIVSGNENEIKSIFIKVPCISLTPGIYILDIGAVIGIEKLDILQGFVELTILQGPIVQRRNPYPSHTTYFSKSFWSINLYNNV